VRGLAGFGLLIGGLPDHSKSGLLISGRDQLDQQVASPDGRQNSQVAHVITEARECALASPDAKMCPESGETKDAEQHPKLRSRLSSLVACEHNVPCTFRRDGCYVVGVIALQERSAGLAHVELKLWVHDDF
jgi:hypothetical protein